MPCVPTILNINVDIDNWQRKSETVWDLELHLAFKVLKLLLKVKLAIQS
jgi:hypothetical protein